MGMLGGKNQDKRLGGGSARLSSSFPSVLAEEAPVRLDFSLLRRQSLKTSGSGFIYQLKKTSVSCIQPVLHPSHLHYCCSVSHLTLDSDFPLFTMFSTPVYFLRVFVILFLWVLWMPSKHSVIGLSPYAFHILF